MNRTVTATSSPIIPSSSSSSSSARCGPSIIQWRVASSVSGAYSPRGHGFSSSSLKLTSHGGSEESARNRLLRCNSSTRPGGPGENESKSVLDAFFLGKALAEAVSERIESTVGEILSTVGRLQAEQQKQVQDFQEEVLEKARRAKERAARETMETQGLIPKSSAAEASRVANGGATSSIASSAPNPVSPAVSTTPSDSSVQPSNSTDGDPLLGVSTED